MSEHPAAQAPETRLLIFAGGDGHARKGRFAAALRLWQARLLGKAPAPRHGPLHVQVVDLQGAPLFEQGELTGWVALPLPAGTYHITAEQDGRQRRYTVTLEAGCTFELRLRDAADVS